MAQESRQQWRREERQERAARARVMLFGSRQRYSRERKSREVREERRRDMLQVIRCYAMPDDHPSRVRARQLKVTSRIEKVTQRAGV